VTPATRRRLDKKLRREELIAAGKTIFASAPYDALSAAEIARRGEVSIGLLYHYFGDKRGFYLAVIDSLAADLLDSVPEGDVHGMLEGFLDFVSRHSHAYAALIHGGVGSDPQAAAITERVREAFLERLAKASGLRPAPALDAALYGWTAMVEGAAHRWNAKGRKHKKDLIASLLAALEAVLKRKR
jgi:AcrR family transcriptional regulator